MPTQKPEETREALIAKRKNYKPKPSMRGKKRAGPGTWNTLYELLALQPQLSFEETSGELIRRGYGRITEEEFNLRKKIMQATAKAMILTPDFLMMEHGERFETIDNPPLTDVLGDFLVMFITVLIDDTRSSCAQASDLLEEEYGMLPPVNNTLELMEWRLIMMKCLKAIETNATELQVKIPSEVWDTLYYIPADDQAMLGDANERSD